MHIFSKIGYLALITIVLSNTSVFCMDGVNAFRFGDSEEIIRGRLAPVWPACVNQQDRTGRTPLFYAVDYRCPGIVRELIVAGADINHRNLRDETALHYAVWAGRADTDIADMLLKAGANCYAMTIKNNGR